MNSRINDSFAFFVAGHPYVLVSTGQHRRKTTIYLGRAFMEPEGDRSTQLRGLLDYIVSEDRICLQPIEWLTFWELLPSAARSAPIFNPASPPILTQWRITSDGEKAARLREHVLWASEHGALEAADAYLRNLPIEAWHCASSSEVKIQSLRMSGRDSDGAVTLDECLGLGKHNQ